MEPPHTVCVSCSLSVHFRLCIPLRLLNKSVCRLLDIFICYFFLNLRCTLDPCSFLKLHLFCVFHLLANATPPNLVWSSRKRSWHKESCVTVVRRWQWCWYRLAVSVGGLDRQRLRGEQGFFLPAGDLALAAWVSPKPLSPRRALFTTVHLNLSHRFDTASLGVHSEMTYI